MQGSRELESPITTGELISSLVSSGILDRAAGERITRALEHGSGGLAETIVGLGILTDDALADALAAAASLPRLTEAQRESLGMVDGPVTSRFQLLNQIAVCTSHGGADASVLVLRDPSNAYAIEATEFALRQPLAVVVGSSRDLEAIHGNADSGSPEAPTDFASDAGLDIERLRESALDAPIVKLVNDLIADAVEAGASDLHFEPLEHSLRVRQRLDGVLRKVRDLPASQLAPIISRLKIMASLDIGERRLPQDGAIVTNVRGRIVDLRIATAPSVRGEAAAVRILNQSRGQLDLEDLGMPREIIEGIGNLLKSPNGLVLVTGPTGSGKSTTLYGMLRKLNDGSRRILTVEDPVEFKIDGVSQIQVKPEIGLTFASALRSLLRHDPNVILVGEIRDSETAQVAVQAALTGHLVLASLHTNSAAGAVVRLQDMGIESFLIASTLRGVLAQRLVRRACKACGGAAERRSGCSACKETGYSGRIAVSELLQVSEKLRGIIANEAGLQAMEAEASQEGMKLLPEVANDLAVAGETTLEEILRLSLY